MNWLYYLAEANLYLGVFYLSYRVFLANETYYQLNRAYLLFACIVSFILPVLQIGALKPVEHAITISIDYSTPMHVNASEFTPLPDAILQAAPIAESATQIAAEPQQITYQLTAQDYLLYTYIMGSAVLLLLLAIKVYSLFKLTRNAERVPQDDHKLIYLPGTDAAFSFFNFLFIGTHAHGTHTIIRHELVHIRQKHSIDIIFLELLKIINWFNPFIYLIQHSLKTLHEYIADEQTAAHETDNLSYSSFLVNNAYGSGGPSITHSFFNYNLLKKRIIMLNQKRSGSLARLKYLVTLPICAALLCTSTLSFSKNYVLLDLDPAKAVSAKSVPVKKADTKPKNLSASVKATPLKPVAIKVNNLPKSEPIFKISPAVAAKNNADVEQFYKDMMYYMQYPKEDLENKVQGRVLARFSVDEKGELQYLSILRSPSGKMSWAVYWAIKYGKVAKPPKGNWILPVYFLIDNKTDQYAALGNTIKPDTVKGRITYDTLRIANHELIQKWTDKPKGYTFAPNGVTKELYEHETVLSNLTVKAPQQ